MATTSACVDPGVAIALGRQRLTRPLRVLAFVEARGVTAVVRNLLNVAAVASHLTPRIEYRFVTYWRAATPGGPGPSTSEIQACIDAAARAGIRTDVLHERYAGDPRLLGEVRAVLRRTDADLIETHHVKSHALVAACGSGLAHRWIAYHHGYTTTTLKTRAHNLLDRWSLTRPAAIVTPCRAFADQLTRRGIDRSRITVVHSCVAAPPRPAVADIRSPLGLDAGDRVVLTVGRLSREKAQAVLIAAFAREPLARLRRTALIIVGDGRERAALGALAARLGLRRVHLVGRQHDVWPYYDAADAVALPSDSEGSPLALLEAMAAGKAIVATRVGGVPEIVEHGRTGLLVPPRDADARAAALARVLEDRQTAAALAAQARTSVEQRFTSPLRARALAALYSRVCQT